MSRNKSQGQGLVEYAFILILVALVAIAGLTLFGTSLDTAFGTIAAKF